MIKDIKEDSFGTCAYGKTSPKRNSISATTKSINILLSFDDALKLNLAIDECVRKINKYKRNSVAGKRAALNLIIHLDLERIAIKEGKI